MDELNPYSRGFAERLFAAYPEWRALAGVDPDGFPPPGSLLLTAESPVAGRSMSVRTYGDQVTVDFGRYGWHQHFGEWSRAGEDATFGAALKFIDALLTERVVVATWFLWGRPLWSTTLAGDATPRRGIASRVEVYSWLGGRDAVLVRG